LEWLEKKAMRRRRQKNPLLMRIVMISILIHIIALPILAHFGTFKAIQEHFLDTRLVTLPPPEAIKDKQAEKKIQKVVHHLQKAAKSKVASAASHAHQASHKSNLNIPKVIASAGDQSGNGDNAGNTVDAGGTGAVGQVPTPNKTPGDNSGEKKTAPEKTAQAPSVPVKETVHNTTEPHPAAPTVVQPAPPPKPAPPPTPIFSEAQPVYSPQPDIPDSLREEAMDKTCVALVTIQPDGRPSDIQIVTSSGNNDLDQLAINTARKWKFKPATENGAPVVSQVRLHIEFEVE
jgi:protein TonB